MNQQPSKIAATKLPFLDPIMRSQDCLLDIIPQMGVVGSNFGGHVFKTQKRRRSTVLFSKKKKKKKKKKKQRAEEPKDIKNKE